MAEEQGMNFTNLENEGNYSHIGVCEKKYFALKKRCEQLQQVLSLVTFHVPNLVLNERIEMGDNISILEIFETFQ